MNILSYEKWYLKQEKSEVRQRKRLVLIALRKNTFQMRALHEDRVSPPGKQLLQYSSPLVCWSDRSSDETMWVLVVVLLIVTPGCGCWQQQSSYIVNDNRSSSTVIDLLQQKLTLLTSAERWLWITYFHFRRGARRSQQKWRYWIPRILCNFSATITSP